MSDTTPTPRPDEPTPLADETAREIATGEQPLTTSPDPADHTDTAEAPTLPPDYVPVSASQHVAPEAQVPATADAENGDTDAAQQERAAEHAIQPETAAAAAHEPAKEPGVEPRFDAESAGAAPEPSSEPVPERAPASESASVPTPPSTPVPASAEPPAAPAPAPATSTATPAPADGGYAGPTYLQPTTAPKKRGNRGLGILIAVLAAIVFAAANLAATYGILELRYGGSRSLDFLESYVKGWDFWVPLAVFVAAFIALVAIVNRGRWWAYVLGSVVVAALVFASYYGAALLTTKAWNLTPGEFRTFSRDYFQSNIVYLWVAVAATFIALEVVTWFGAWIAFHGQQAKRRNAEARAAYEAELEQSSAR